MTVTHLCAFIISATCSHLVGRCFPAAPPLQPPERPLFKPVEERHSGSSPPESIRCPSTRPTQSATMVRQQEQRVVICARVIGAVRRDAPKLKMFMISASWSDQTEAIIYRSFDNFKKFHRQLKKRFPHLNPFRRSDRMIPKFNGKARRSSIQQRGSNRLFRRMKFLETYCDKLFQCDHNVTQSSEVTQFFTPKDHDLQPDFTKNSVVILPSEEVQDGPAGGGGAGNVTHPFITQSYRCVAAYETKDTKNRPFKVALDEKLDVLIKDPAGWWLVENEEKHLAWFPAPYLELWEAEEQEEEEVAGGALYCAVRTYSTTKTDEVSVPIGSVVEVLRKSDDGWWVIRFNGKAGYIPSMYLQLYNNPRAGLYSLQKQLHSSTLNLATRRESQLSAAAIIPERRSELRAESRAPGTLQKSRSLDVLSETWTRSALPAHSASADVDARGRSMSRASTGSSSNSFSSDSESSFSLKDEIQGKTSPGRSAPSPGSSGQSSPLPSASASGSFQISETGSAAPRVPPRPKTEEILTRCTTMTRKAALATKTRLHVQTESIYGR